MQTLFLNAAIVDATASTPRMGNVLVEDGIIRDLQAKAGTADHRQVIDLHGKTLMPGLIDCHVHVVASMLNLGMNAQLPDAIAVLRSLPIMKGMLSRGFTTVRDLGGAPYSLAEAIEQGLAEGPRLIVCGKALSKTGGHGDARSRYDTYDPNRWKNNFGALGRIADGVDEVRLACRQELRQGARFIKIMANGGVASPIDPVAWKGYSADEITAAVEEARDSQTYVAAHLYTSDAIARAIKCGVHSLEHCNCIDAATAHLAAETGAVAVPTLVTYDALAEQGAALGLPPASVAKIDEVRRNGLDSLAILHKAGVSMAFGTDLLGELHVRQNEEFAIRAQVLPAAEILASATTVAAELIGMQGKLGIIAEGAIADIIVVDGSPLDDITVLASPARNILLVMKSGIIYRSL
jgi:imidazolonepropionase-like amidohydrolase